MAFLPDGSLILALASMMPVPVAFPDGSLNIFR
jgi:hypothetical protein